MHDKDYQYHFVFLTPSLSIPTNLLVWKGTLDHCQKNNIKLSVIAGRQWNPDSEFAFANQGYHLVNCSDFDGIIMYGGALGFNVSQAVLEQMLQQLPDIPKVNIGIQLPGIPSITIDNYQGMKEGVHHLILHHQCRDIAFVKGPEEHPEAQMRLKAYKDALTESKIPINDHRIYPGEFRIGSGREAVMTILEQGKPYPDAIVAADDDTAYGILEYLQEADIAVPREIKVLGFDNSDLGKSTDIPLTTIDQNLFGQGKEASKSLFKLLSGEKLPDNINPSMNLAIRESCGCNQELEDHIINTEFRSNKHGKRLRSNNHFSIMEELSSLSGSWRETNMISITEEFLSAISNYQHKHDVSSFDAPFQNLKKFIRTEDKDYYLFQQFIALLETQIHMSIEEENDQWIRENFQNIRSILSKETQKKEIKKRMLSDYSIGEMNYFNTKLNNIDNLNDFKIHLRELLDTFGIEQLHLVFADLKESKIINKEIRYSYNSWKDRQGVSTVFPIEDDRILPDDFDILNDHKPLIINSFNTQKRFYGYIVFVTDEFKSSFTGFIATQISNAYERYLISSERIQKTKELQDSLQKLGNTQKQLIEAEKMAALGNLVAGVAHEINTPLGISITAASFMQNELEAIKNTSDGEDLKRLEKLDNSLSLILRNLVRAGNLIRTFKTVAVDQAVDEIRSFNLVDYLEEIKLGLQSRLDQKKVALTYDCPEQLPLTNYPGPFFQIFTNLIINSLDHGFENDISGGEIQIQVKVVQEDIHIQYSDTGKGVSPKVASRIFEPFVTTRRDKGNTGLGMHIIYNLINQTLKGTIQLKETSKGACFLIVIPRNQSKIHKDENSGS